MKKFLIIIAYLTFGTCNRLYGLEIDVTQGRIEPLPVAIVEFNHDESIDEKYSSEINEIVSNNLRSTGLFKILSEKSFLQPKNEVYLQPLFSDWRLIDANFIIAGKLQAEDNFLKINFKLWDVYQEKLIINKNIKGILDKDIRISSHLISNFIYESITGEKGYFDTKIVYVAEDSKVGQKQKRIAIMDFDGENHEILTNGKNLVLTPRFSPDGKNIVFLQKIHFW